MSALDSGRSWCWLDWLLRAKSTCSQLGAEDDQDAVAMQLAADVSYSDETGRRVGQGAGTRTTASGKKP